MGNTKENMHLDIGEKRLIKVFVPRKTPRESFLQLSKLNTRPEYKNSTHKSIPKFPVFSELSSSDSLDFLFLCFSFSAFCLKYLKKKHTHTHTVNCFCLSVFWIHLDVCSMTRKIVTTLNIFAYFSGKPLTNQNSTTASRTATRIC